MKFENGFAISVQWGTMNYCQNKNLGAGCNDEMEEKFWKSASAEIAVYGKNGGMLPIGDGESVIGWLSTDDVAKVIEGVASAESRDEIIKQVKTYKDGKEII